MGMLALAPRMQQSCPMRVVKLMPAYFCPPIWLYLDESGVPVNVDARDLPLSTELVARIKRWDEVYQDTFEVGQGFVTEAELDVHLEEGIEIAQEIAFELEGWAGASVFEPNADLAQTVERDSFTIVRAPRSLVFDPEMTRRSA